MLRPLLHPASDLQTWGCVYSVAALLLRTPHKASITTGARCSRFRLEQPRHHDTTPCSTRRVRSLPQDRSVQQAPRTAASDHITRKSSSKTQSLGID